MDPCVFTLELLGLLVNVVGWLCALATTLMPQWLTQSTELLTTESYLRGLWETCVVQETGGTGCRAYDSLLGVPQDLKLARSLMCISLAVGMLGILLAIPGLHIVKSCSQGQAGRRAKMILKMMAGVLAMVAGVLTLIPASYVAYLTVEEYWDKTIPDVLPRWDFGEALFCGWVGGFLFLVAGFLLVASCLCPQIEPSRGYQTRYDIQSIKHPSRKPPEYV